LASEDYVSIRGNENARAAAESGETVERAAVLRKSPQVCAILLECNETDCTSEDGNLIDGQDVAGGVANEELRR
jgi:hypothetical protein